MLKVNLIHPICDGIVHFWGVTYVSSILHLGMTTWCMSLRNIYTFVVLYKAGVYNIRKTITLVTYNTTHLVSD